MRHSTRRARRPGLAAILSTLLAVGALPLAAGPAFASAGASLTTLLLYTAGGTIEYGHALTMEARVRDVSDSCTSATGAPPLGGCDNPDGRIDFYSITGGVQTYLTSEDLTIYYLDGDIPTNTMSTTNYVETCCLEPDTYTIRAYYVPGDFDPTSADAPLTVSKATPTATLTQSVAGANYGVSVTFNVHVAGAPDPHAAKPSGSVTISDGTTQYGTAVLDANGDASISTTHLPAGISTLHAAYSGDSRYETALSATVDHEVFAADSSTSLGASATSTHFGDSVTFTATVAADDSGSPTPTGSVTFRDGSAVIGTGFLNELDPDEATYSLDTLAVGSHTITAEYNGDAGFVGSTSGGVTVTVAKASTTTTLTSSANPSVLGQAVTFIASVSGPGSATPTGTVQFRDGAANLGSPQSVSAGAASLTISTLPGGAHSITAVYSGSASYNGSTSNAVSQTVSCDHMITGAGASVIVNSGSTCLSGAKLAGSITVNGGSLSIYNSTISGGVTVNGGTTTLVVAGPSGTSRVTVGPITICRTTVSGNVSVKGASGFVLIGDPVDDACAGSWLKGTVTLSGNQGGFALDNNRIGGWVSVTNNVGSGPGPNHEVPEVEANSISGYLAVSNNSPAVTDEGRPNLVRGKPVAI